MKQKPFQNGREIISWKDLYGNKFVEKIKPEMLKEKGFAIVRETHERPGGSHNYGAVQTVKKECLVVFDRSYVAARIRSLFFGCMQEFPIDELHALIDQLVAADDEE